MLLNNAYIPSLEAQVEMLGLGNPQIVSINREEEIERLKFNLEYQQQRFDALIEQPEYDFDLYRYLRNDIRTMRRQLRDHYKVNI